ncbi:MIP/aquaporin family protein [Flavilitoribacter nigricans]|uniref:Aquaporin n=1 Tax=Flavilitoribacter nigricans (strain ATCC 23147 / DSM 23189 / NBRC 102662 / NCIMB 1420 / SS-2) TaxID=1122177 RepID=A0A2D0N4P3_FLAN2|nr:MIP/aquaporin family protein [Flavilitoribacter nigricans]PHN03465.1 aquaporin [Flavilitoribacter nigricans DSM 23189 = NBRC 102662]
MEVYIAEFFGTALLILLGDGVVAGVLLKDSKAEGSNWWTITIGWGLAVTFGVYLAGMVSGAHINPAVTLALAAGGEFSWSLVPGYILAQFLGAMLGATLVWLHYYPHWERTEDKAAKLGIFCTAPAIRHAPSNFFSEFLGTFILLLGLMALGANQFSDGLNPMAVGALVVVIGVCLGGTTGYAINPARDLGPRVAHFLLPIPGKGDSDWSYSWIPVLGPILGGIAAVLFYQAVF